MKDQKKIWKNYIHEILLGKADEGDYDFTLSTEQIVLELPSNPDFGDFAFPMFPYAKIFRQSPGDIAGYVHEKIVGEHRLPGEVSRAGGYLNVKIDRVSIVSAVIAEVLSRRGDYGSSESLSGRKIMVEFSCPNTNKPLHLGHLRNDAIGESISRILGACGAEVMKVNLINDRGIHICKSMLAYDKFGGGATPESEQIKSDHFVGNYYVRFNALAKEEEGAEEAAQALLRKWEDKDPHTLDLWNRMNTWAIQGIEETYARTGISFDRIYRESETYEKGREEVFKGVEKGTFYRDEEGTVWVDLSEIDLDKKVLLRKDGTSLYLTQDIGTAIARRKDWDFDRLIYVVGSEQKYHFTVLFHVLTKLGFPWAKHLFHLSYGMVNLPEGKMKSREGTVVDADDLLDELHTMAEKEILEKERVREDAGILEAAEAIAIGALNYFLLRVTPGKDMVFDPKESLSFTGDTGPYLQYMGARISSMLRKFEERRKKLEGGAFRPELLTIQEEWELVKMIASFEDEVRQAAEELNPSRITSYLYSLAKIYSRYYHDNPILHNKDNDLVHTRIALSRALLQVLNNAFTYLAIPFLEAM